MELKEDKPLYGIWLIGKGWLKGKDTVTFTNHTVAQQVADRFGNAKVYFIDKSLEDLEKDLLEIEHRKSLRHIWLTFKNLLTLKTK